MSMGVPKATIDKFLGTATQVMDFATGNGSFLSDKSIGMTSPTIGERECYELKSSPFAVSLGQTVEEQLRPFVWIPGQKPFHVTDMAKLKILCPLRYRIYADRVEANVPNF